MVWIYSLASEDLLSQSRSGSDPSLTANQTHIVKAFSYHECMAAISRKRPYGTTCELSQLPRSETSISSTAVSHARTSALRAMGQAWRVSEAVWLRRFSGLPKNSVPHSFSLKTFRQSEPEVLAWLSKHWPASGMTVAGVCYPLSTWERRTKEPVGSYWPTACANDSKSHRNATVKNRKVAGHSGVTLTDFVTLFPTPSASSYGTNKGGAAGRVGPSRPSLNTLVGGSLNPAWVEWLMGYPNGWTVCEAWAMPSSRPKRGKRSATLPA